LFKDISNLRMLAKTFFGLEEVLADELRKLGAKNVAIHTRAVSFEGDLGFMYKANVSLRTALRILVHLKSCTVSNASDLYKKASEIEWTDIFDIDENFRIESTMNSDLFDNNQFLSLKVKDAIVDQFRRKFGRRPDVEKMFPDFTFHLHLFENELSFWIDSTGDSLHKRGYRKSTGIAPINEVLAAGMVALCGWDTKVPFVDPMCGSGTIAIEAALYAGNIPPGIFRENYAFNKWKIYDANEYATILESRVEKINDYDIQILATDQSPNNLKRAKENIKSAGVEEMISVRESSFEDLITGFDKGVAIINPPYGERMDKDDLPELYKTMGNAFKKNFKGFAVWVISSNIEALKFVGLRPTRRITLYNGALECKFQKFEIYEGSKRTKFQNRDHQSSEEE